MRYLWMISLAMAIGCKGEVKQSGTPPQQSATTPANGNDATDGQSVETNSGGQFFYAGFDGANDYSLLVPGFREYKIADATVAKITKETVKLSEDTISALIAKVKAENSQFDATAESRFRSMLTRDQTAIRIVPLKAGRTKLTSSRGSRGGRDAWGSGDATLELVVNSYSQAQYDAGKSRYTTDNSGNLKACRACHETAEEDAPPHELGNIKEISDSQGIEWITTGKTGSREARITHTWEFNSEDEKSGILAYLRAKGSKDLETFTRLVFEERFQNFEFPPQRSGPGGPVDTTTTTTTTVP
jgi:cytochrome c553